MDPGYIVSMCVCGCVGLYACVHIYLEYYVRSRCASSSAEFTPALGMGKSGAYKERAFISTWACVW